LFYHQSLIDHSSSEHFLHLQGVQTTVNSLVNLHSWKNCSLRKGLW